MRPSDEAAAQLARRQGDPRGAVELDHGRRCAPGVPDARDHLGSGVRRHPNLDRPARCPLGEQGEEVLGEQLQVRAGVLLASERILDRGGVLGLKSSGHASTLAAGADGLAQLAALSS